MKTRFTYLLLLFLIATAFQAIGQVKTKIYAAGVPAALRPLKSRPADVLSIPIPAAFTGLKKAASVSPLYNNTNQFAVPVKQDINLAKRATLIRENGQLVYTLTVKAAGALNINCQFSEFRLPQGAVLKIFTDKEITDSITARENNEHNVWATRVYLGDELHFALTLPEAQSKELLLKIDKINIGFRPYGADFGNVGFSAPCHVNANCPGGNGWDPEKNAVAIIVANGAEACTGSLLMNTCSFNNPYFLTANHCLDAGNVPNWVFQFQTWSTDCTTNTGWIETVQFNGCTLRANNAASDFALLELNTVPAAGSGIHYAGWSRTTTGITSTTVLHHPAGDLMKISRDDQGPTAVSDVTDITRDCWEINQDLGRLEGGSSGAPYFDQNHRVIGQHFRRPQAGILPVCDITIARGGRFASSWTGGGTNATRLSNWLDPSNSGAATTNTSNVNALSGTTNSLTISGDAAICTGSKTYTASNVPAGSTVTWSASNGYVTITPSGNSVTVTVNPGSTGNVTLSASTPVSASGCATSNTATKVISVGGPYAGFNINVHPGWPTSCWEVWAFNYFKADLAFGSGYTAMEWGYTYLGVDYPGPETWDTYTFLPPDAGTYEVYVRPKNSCGVGPKSTRIVEVTWACGPGFRIQASPNPAKGVLYVTIAGADQQISKQAPASTTLILREVISGRIVKQWKAAGSQKQLALSLTGIKKGNYILTIESGNIKQSKQIIVE